MQMTVTLELSEAELDEFTHDFAETLLRVLPDRISDAVNDTAVALEVSPKWKAIATAIGAKIKAQCQMGVTFNLVQGRDYVFRVNEARWCKMN